MHNARIRRAVIMNEITVNDQAPSHRAIMDAKDCKTYFLINSQNFQSTKRTESSVVDAADVILV